MMRVGLALAVSFLAGLLAAPAALASFHLVQVREVYPGSVANPDADYVELQMWASGQELVAGHKVRLYDAGGAVVGTTTFAANVPNGANQSTILLATPQAAAQFSVTADVGLTGSLSPAGGAACWEDLDCVAWGAFAGALPSPAGAPAAPGGVPDGIALRRTIARGCATALDPQDDSDDSSADFAATTPEPRPNSAVPPEQPCSSGGAGAGGGSPQGGKGTPQTTLRRKPPKRTRDRTPTFRFASDEASSKFECKVDGRRFRPCRSPFTTKVLRFGAHTFRVRAVDSDGRADPSPATYRFTVLRPRA